MKIKLTLVSRALIIRFPQCIQSQRLTTGPILHRPRVSPATTSPAPPHAAIKKKFDKTLKLKNRVTHVNELLVKNYRL
jgi:hypothetical protein